MAAGNSRTIRCYSKKSKPACEQAVVGRRDPYSNEEGHPEWRTKTYAIDTQWPLENQRFDLNFSSNYRFLKASDCLKNLQRGNLKT